MQQAIAFAVTLRDGSVAATFEASFREAVRDVRHRFEHARPWPPAFDLYRQLDAAGDYVWVTRFPDEEFGRVTRAAWPFVLLAILDIAKHLQERFSVEMSCFSAPVTSPQELVEAWNAEFGRFTKMSFDTAGSSTPRDDEAHEVVLDHPTNQELVAVTDELRGWRVERFIDRADRRVLKLFPREDDAIHEPFELRLAQSGH